MISTLMKSVQRLLKPNSTKKITLSVSSAQKIMAASQKSEAISDTLQALHTLEFALSSQYQWPWMRWKFIAESAPKYLACFPSEMKTSKASNSLEHDIFLYALEIRRPAEETMTTAPLFKKHPNILKDSQALNRTFMLELMFIAFAAKNWPVVQHVSHTLLSNPDVCKNLPAEVRDQVFDTHVFSYYRPAMPTYVQNPKPLMDKLFEIKGDNIFEEILNANSKTSMCFQANLLALQGDFEKALPLYEKANNADGFKTSVFTQTDVILSPRNLLHEFAPDLSNWYKNYSSLTINYTHKPHKEHAILVSCDPSYFDLYAELYIEIVATTNPNALVHFHLLNFSDPAKTTKLLRTWEKTHNIRINSTFETNDLMNELPHLKGGICANSRYIYLPDYMSQYTSVTVTDIDGWLLKPLSELMDFGNNDILISSMTWRKKSGYWRLPWGNISAGYLSINTTETSLNYAKHVAIYMLKNIRQNAYIGKPLFYADQAALFLCLHYATEHYGMKIGFLGGGFAQSAEQAFHTRIESKRSALQAKLKELQAKHNPQN